MDLDHFKIINDQHGHEAGDNTLQSVATLIKSRLRSESDDVYRYGGEEFLLLLNNTELSGACQLAEALRGSIASTLGITASFGCAQHKEGESWDDWIERADQQLYEAKNAGRNIVRPAFNTTNGLYETENAPQ
ncbi:GGDEF domain-containing protein [Gilvimarinus chinensis]|uniref:GGDEF domain-containing protein n=1 Tax=Gilvimarinus chinensis TaxID=396005 RepID=UPI000372F2CE|nr:GGDEF domain-containing protein [Gilvimarinus chinensis]